MKARGKETPPKEVPSPSELIDEMVRSTDGWRGETLAQLRALVRTADPEIVEEVKWRKPSNPDGVPVWSHDGIVCIANVLKNAVRLTFPYGPEIKDPKKLFNTRLDSKVVRAIDVFEGAHVDESALVALIARAVRNNGSRVQKVKARRQPPG